MQLGPRPRPPLTREWCLAEIAAFRTLEYNWDTYQGLPVAEKAMATATDIINALDDAHMPCVIYACPDSTIEMDWCVEGHGEHWLFIYDDGRLEYSANGCDFDPGGKSLDDVVADIHQQRIQHNSENYH